MLIEVEEQQQPEADRIAQGIAQVPEVACLRRPILLHGIDATVWHFIGQARARGWSTCVGLKDGALHADGRVAADNAALVAEAAAICRAPA